MIHIGKSIDYKIEVLLNNNCAFCDEYHYTVFAYDMKSTNHSWYNTGICGSAPTPEKAFKKGYEEYKRSLK